MWLTLPQQLEQHCEPLKHNINKAQIGTCHISYLGKRLSKKEPSFSDVAVSYTGKACNVTLQIIPKGIGICHHGMHTQNTPNPLSNG